MPPHGLAFVGLHTRANDAHHWRRDGDIRYVRDAESRRPVYEPCSASVMESLESCPDEVQQRQAEQDCHCGETEVQTRMASVSGEKLSNADAKEHNQANKVPGNNKQLEVVHGPSRAVRPDGVEVARHEERDDREGLEQEQDDSKPASPIVWNYPKHTIWPNDRSERWRRPRALATANSVGPPPSAPLNC